MATYSLAVQTVAAASGAAYASIHAPSTRTARILEVHAFVNAATASSIGLGLAGNSPVASASVVGDPDDPLSGASLVNVDTAWSTAPTVPAKFKRRFVSPNTAGSGIIWTFPRDRPLIVDVSKYLVLWNFGGAAGSVLSATFCWEE